MSAGSAAGGSGSLTVDNKHSSTIVDASAATSRSGVSVALAPTPNGAASPATGITTANSGTSAAAGITASNDVGNTAVAGVAVGGASQAPVSLTSNSQAVIRDQGASAAQSGAAWAVAPDANGSPSGVATPAVAGAAPTSGSVSVTGLQARNDLSNTTQSNVVSAGGPTNTAPITIAPNQSASVDARGVAVAASGAACTGSACPGGTATNGTSGATQASSGGAQAQGLVAQNRVETNAAVAVRVAGQNFAPIKVIIDSITQIFNVGIGSSTSGDATAGGASGSGTSGSPQAASSGSAQATGAQVTNNVNLRSSASVQVKGDNYNPINVVLNLAANLVNWGMGLASSGDAQGSGTGSGGSAGSGGASATGLRAMNVVSMWADALVDIQGNNYAPITVEVHFKTNIENRGLAAATSGNVAAGSSASSSGRSNTNKPVPATDSASNMSRTSTTASSAGSNTVASQAHAGSSVGIGNSVDSTFTSAQLSSANGGKPIASSAMTQLLRDLPPGDWSPFVERSMAITEAPQVQQGLTSSSGDSWAVGLQSRDSQTNVQMAACSDPGVSCTARNIATLSVTSHDSDTNPAVRDANNNSGPGGTHAETGFAGANVTPTPTPAPTRAGSNTTSDHTTDRSAGNSGAGSRRGGSSRVTTRYAEADLVANGHVVLVDLWDEWPGRRLPPMPDPLANRPTVTSVNASGLAWPGADELPLPTSSTPALDEEPAASRLISGVRRPSGSHDAEAETDEAVSLLAIVPVDPWSKWPAIEELPTPGQVLPASGNAEAPAPASTEAAPSDAGVTWIDFSPEAILVGLLGALGASRRTRGLFVSALLAARRVFSRPMWPTRLGGLTPGRSAARGIAFLRLTLGIFRLW